jgi:hypothetical protein
MTQRPEPQGPTTDDALDEILGLVTGLGVLFLPLFLLAVPCLVLLLPLALPAIPLALAAAPVVVFRAVRGRLRGAA